MTHGVQACPHSFLATTMQSGADGDDVLSQASIEKERAGFKVELSGTWT